MYYIYIQSTTKRKQQRSAEKDTTSKLKHSKPLALKKRKEKKTVFFHSLYKHTNHTANVVQKTHTGWNLILLKGGGQYSLSWPCVPLYLGLACSRIMHLCVLLYLDPVYSLIISAFCTQHILIFCTSINWPCIFSYLGPIYSGIMVLYIYISWPCMLPYLGCVYSHTWPCILPYLTLVCSHILALCVLSQSGKFPYTGLVYS